MQLEKNVLVTGGAGIAGCNIVGKLLQLNCNIVVLDNLSAYPFNYLKEFGVGGIPDVRFIRGDIRDSSLVKNTIKKIDVVVHAAAYADVGACVENPRMTYDVNVSGTQNVLDAAMDAQLEKFIFISSASVYGQPSGKCFAEDDPCFPISNYGVAKLWGEQQAIVYSKLSDVSTYGTN